MYAAYCVSWHPSKRNSALLSANIDLNECVRRGMDGGKPSSLPTRVGFMPMILPQNSRVRNGSRKVKPPKKGRTTKSAQKAMVITFFDYRRVGGWFRELHFHAETVDEGPHPKKAAGPRLDVEAPSRQRSTSRFATSDRISCAQADPGCIANLYSPDLAPNDFYLYPTAKKDLKGKCFPIIIFMARVWVFIEQLLYFLKNLFKIYIIYLKLIP